MKPFLLVIFLGFIQIITIHQAYSQQNNYDNLRDLFDKGDLDSISYYIDQNNIDVNAHYPEDFILPLLFYACSSGNQEIVSYLLEKGANPNVLSKYGTPAHWASEKGNVHIISLLINHDFNPKIEEISYWVNKYKNGDDDIPDWLVEIIRKVLKDGMNYSNYPYLQFTDPADLLLLASSIYHDTTGNFELTHKMIDFGVNINLMDKLGFNALIWSIIAVKPNAVELLIQNGADVNLPVLSLTFSDNPSLQDNNITPLHFVAFMLEERPKLMDTNYEDILKIVKLLVEAGADTEAETNIEKLSVYNRFKNFDNKKLLKALK